MIVGLSSSMIFFIAFDQWDLVTLNLPNNLK